MYPPGSEPFWFRAGGAWMGLGSRFRFDKPEAQVFQDGLDDLPVFNETDNPHDSPTSPLSRGQASGRSGDHPSPINSRIGSDLLNEPRPVLPVFLRTLIRFLDARDPVVLGFFPFFPADAAGISIIPSAPPCTGRGNPARGGTSHSRACPVFDTGASKTF